MTDQNQPEQPQGTVPEAEFHDYNPGGATMKGVARMIQPTIMQCNQGGFITVIPGIGVYAASSMEEAVNFIAIQADSHFKSTNGGKSVFREFPRILAGAGGSITEGFTKAAKRVDAVIVATVAIGMLIGYLTIFGGSNNDKQATAGRQEERPNYISPAGASQGPSLGSSYRAGDEARGSGKVVLPEIHLLRVRPTTNDRDSQPLPHAGFLRPLFNNN